MVRETYDPSGVPNIVSDSWSYPLEIVKKCLKNLHSRQ